MSFILPVYNVEPYLEKSILSIRDKNLSFEEYEIIIINDGSTDNSESIVRRLQKKIPNIILINQSNAGVSAARNRGIEMATGEYLVFVDPDDYINANLLKILYERAKRDNLDILLSGRSIVKPNGEIIHKVGYERLEDMILDGIAAFYEKDKPYPVFDTCWGRLYRRKLIADYKVDFPVGVIHLEDGVFVRKIFAVASRVGFENCDFYQAFERPGSASRSDIGKSLKAYNGDILSIKNLLNFKEVQSIKKASLELINTGIIKYTLLPLMRAVNARDFKMLIYFNRRLNEENLKPLCLDFVPNGIYLDLAKAYNKSFILFIIKYIIRKKIQHFKKRGLQEGVNKKKYS